MGGLALGQFGYDNWWKFTWPLLVILLLLYAIVLSVGVLMSGQIFLLQRCQALFRVRLTEQAVN